MESGRSIAIIGGGFSGTVLAARLLRESTQPTRVILINRSGRMARGVAYGTRSTVHVLNVPAGRMGAFAEDEAGFLKFARGIDSTITGGTFVRRNLYGDYLEHVLDEAIAAAGRNVIFEQIVGDVVKIDCSRGDFVDLILNDERRLSVSAAVLASGNHPPADLPLADRAIFSSPRYVRDPWARGALDSVPNDAPVLLIGTGLTMYDVALELERRGRTAPLFAVSRRGLLPQPHRSPAHPAGHDHVPPDLLTGEATALHYLKSIRRQVRAAEAHGVDWRDVVASLRPITPELWKRLDSKQRRRFMEKLRPFWDVHRHRAAPSIAEKIESMLGRGAMKVSAGRIRSLTENSDGTTATILPRGQRNPTQSRFGAVVNCTGPDCDVSSIRDPLLSSLLQSGTARPCDLAIGLDFDSDYRIIRADGNVNKNLYLLGPLLRGQLWEATAVPELREHARALAAILKVDPQINAD